MKKLKYFVLLFLLIASSFKLSAEMSINLGAGIGFGTRYLKTTDFENNEFLLYGNIPLEFRYFPTRKTNFGFGINVNFMGTGESHEIEYSGANDYYPVSNDTFVIKNRGRTIEKASDYYGSLYPSFNFQFAPTFNYRYNANNGLSHIFSLGPSYSISSEKYFFANKKDYSTVTTVFGYGSKSTTEGYEELTIESIQRDFIGLCFQYQIASSNEKTFGFDSLGFKIGIDFLEKSDFTDFVWKTCFNASIGIALKVGWNFSTILDRKENKKHQELIALQAEEQRKTDEQNRIEAEKKAELEKQQESERLAKEQEEKRQAEILAEEQRKENEKIQRKKKQNADKVLSAFSYDKLPFGKDMQYVLSLCDGTDVKENSETNVYFIKDYSLSLLNGSTYSRALTGLGCYLLGDCTKSYTVTSEYWQNLSSMTLIFTKSYGKSDYTLMMVVKNQKCSDNLIDGKYKTVFDAMKNSITKQVGINPKLFEENYVNEYFRKCYALCARWQPAEKNLYLFVDNSSALSESSRGPIIVYTDNAQCQKYVNAEKNYSAERKRNEESNVKMDF